MSAWWIIGASVLIGIGRFSVPGHGFSWPGIYEAFAHILVGALFALCFQKSQRPVALTCLIAITVLEIVMAALR